MIEDDIHDNFRLDRLQVFWKFVYERQAVWYRRVIERRPPPWTDDPILQIERFTNVYRELDPGTQYVIREILEHHAPRPDKVFNVMLYRLIGRAETHRILGFQSLDNFNPSRVEHTLKWLRSTGLPPFTAAYMVSAYVSMGSRDKIENVVRLLANLHDHFAEFHRQMEASRNAAEIHSLVCSAYGFGNFLAYQVLVDLLYPLQAYGGCGLLPYSHDDWASAGPGARRGIAMLLREGSTASHLSVMHWLHKHQGSEFARLGLQFPYLLGSQGEPVAISLANVQNCLCEFHKYVKIRDGTGRGRRKFSPRTEPDGLTQLQLGFNDVVTVVEP